MLDESYEPTEILNKTFNKFLNKWELKGSLPQLRRVLQLKRRTLVGQRATAAALCGSFNDFTH